MTAELLPGTASPAGQSERVLAPDLVHGVVLLFVAAPSDGVR